jgi:hypothetical protein
MGQLDFPIPAFALVMLEELVRPEVVPEVQSVEPTELVALVAAVELLTLALAA